MSYLRPDHYVVCIHFTSQVIFATATRWLGVDVMVEQVPVIERDMTTSVWGLWRVDLNPKPDNQHDLVEGSCVGYESTQRSTKVEATGMSVLSPT